MQIIYALFLIPFVWTIKGLCIGISIVDLIFKIKFLDLLLNKIHNIHYLFSILLIATTLIIIMPVLIPLVIVFMFIGIFIGVFYLFIFLCYDTELKIK
jgi:hypothetical protein